MNVRVSLLPTLLLAAPFAFSSCVVLELKAGDGVPGTSVREVGAFAAVADESGIDLNVTLGDTPSVSVTCDQNLVDAILTEVDGDVLTVRIDSSVGHPVELLPETDCHVDVVATELRSVTSDGSGDIEVDGDGDLALEAVTASGSGDVLVHAHVVGDSVTFATTGSGEIVVDSLDVDDVTLASSGSGDLRVSQGSAGRLALSTSGSGDVLVRGVTVPSASATLTGSGDGEVTVTQTLDATLTGSGDLTVWGDPPSRDIQATGSGSVLLGD